MVVIVPPFSRSTGRHVRFRRVRSQRRPREQQLLKFVEDDDAIAGPGSLTIAASNHQGLIMNAIVSLAQLRPTATGVEDADPEETAEWCDALDAVVAHCGLPRARYLLDALAQRARRHGSGWTPTLSTPYVNTVVV